LVEPGKVLIDPCPLWDDIGNTYLVHAFAGSRAGIKSILVIKQMNKEGTRTIDEGTIVFDGHVTDPTIEGPKIHKRKGWYYIFAPAGGVSTGWQLVLRSKNVYGPYERKIVMQQGSTPINGPHQGAWIDTHLGEDWFLHFQDKEAYGRVVHLQPMKWVNDWPVIGVDKDGDGTGEPVLHFKKPNVGKNYPVNTPFESDEFNKGKPGLQWQWRANPKATWSFTNVAKGSLRLYADKIPDSSNNYWLAPNLLLQKFPADKFIATVKLSFHPQLENDRTGLIVMGTDYVLLSLVKKSDGNYLAFTTHHQADKGRSAREKIIKKIDTETIWLRVMVGGNAECSFGYSTDGARFEKLEEVFSAKPGRWVGAGLGIFCTREKHSNDSGYADFDWFRVE
jgi:beta-xylosidase